MVEASKYKKVVPYANIENVTEAIKTEESAPADSIDLPTGGVIGIDDIEASEQAVIAPGPEGGDNDTRKAIELVTFGADYSQEKAGTKKPRAKYRSKNDRAELEEHMLIWRQSIYEIEFKGTGMSSNHIITGKTLTAISRIPPPVTLLSLSQTSPAWPKKAYARWGASLLAIVVAFDEPVRTAERKVEAARIQQAIKPTGATKQELIKVEDSQGSPKGKKRVASLTRTVAPSTSAVKKQRRDAPESSALADSALSAGASSRPFPPDSTATIPTTPKQQANVSATT
ncbi:hypothetical protein V565_338480, partial [Rhizoctonia solani 123E]